MQEAKKEALSKAANIKKGKLEEYTKYSKDIISYLDSHDESVHSDKTEYSTIPMTPATSCPSLGSGEMPGYSGYSAYSPPPMWHPRGLSV